MSLYNTLGITSLNLTIIRSRTLVGNHPDRFIARRRVRPQAQRWLDVKLISVGWYLMLVFGWAHRGLTWFSLAVICES